MVTTKAKPIINKHYKKNLLNYVKQIIFRVLMELKLFTFWLELFLLLGFVFLTDI